MRSVVFGLLALALAGPAAADNASIGFITNPIWVTPPPAAALPANFPAADYRAYAALVCRVQGDILTTCRALETPPPDEFLEAARYAAGVARIAPQDGSGRPTDGRDIFLFIDFPPQSPDMAPPPSPPVPLTGVVWTRRPTFQNFNHFYPEAANDAGIGGHVVLDCLVNQSNQIICTVRQETPLGYGFGDASIAISQFFRMAPMTADGRPTAGGRVRVPISFNPP